MATAYIAEYTGLGLTNSGRGQFPSDEFLVAEQTVAIGGGSVQSSPFDLTTRFIRLHVDAICSIAIASNPTATTSKKRLAANQTEYFGVKPGWKIAVISNT